MAQKIKNHWDRWQELNNPRKHKNQNSPRGVILRGAADDRGVLNVGGRLGAAHGPAAVRKLLGQFMLGIQGDLSHMPFCSGSDVNFLPTIKATHDLFRQMLANDLKNNLIPIAIGGGHDYGFPHIAAATDVFGSKKIALINIDAHLDVRPVMNDVITSGSPFFMALESAAINAKNFVEFGIQEHCNDVEYYQYLKKKKVKVLTLEQCRQKKGAVANFKALIREFSKRNLKIIISIDVDAIQMCHAPGVSAPQADGFSVQELFEMVKICAQNKSVVSLGFFELSPPLDIGDQTTRLVATAIHRYVSELGKDSKSK